MRTWALVVSGSNYSWEEKSRSGFFLSFLAEDDRPEQEPLQETVSTKNTVSIQVSAEKSWGSGVYGQRSGTQRTCFPLWVESQTSPNRDNVFIQSKGSLVPGNWTTGHWWSNGSNSLGLFWVLAEGEKQLFPMTYLLFPKRGLPTEHYT